ncbi:MAG TPA: hypothetical protein VFA74_10715 [Terriglobales bacterium]|nr:hypothetical protein [Terriglobales bacterium]
MRFLATASLVGTLLLSIACGGDSSSSSSSQNSAPNGNWQINLTQGEPPTNPQFAWSISGFLQHSDNSLTGSMVIPGNPKNLNCAGVGAITGTLNGENVTIAVDEGGSTVNLTGSIASDNQSMSGQYTTLAGGCTAKPTSGTWTASLIPTLTGKFTGTLANSTYMQVVTGIVPPTPIVVSGELTQTSNIGASNASLSGTITAVDYPCFRTAYLTGTISGENVLLSVFGLDGSQIGNLGSSSGNPPSPAIVSVSSGGISLNGLTNTQSGLVLGNGGSGPCPAILDNNQQPLKADTADVALTFQ